VCKKKRDKSGKKAQSTEKLVGELLKRKMGKMRGGRLKSFHAVRNRRRNASSNCKKGKSHTRRGGQEQNIWRGGEKLLEELTERQRRIGATLSVRHRGVG